MQAKPNRKSYIILLALGVVAVTAARFIGLIYPFTYPLSRILSSTSGYLIKYALILGLLALFIGLIKRDIKKVWLPIFSWLLLTVGVIDLTLNGYIKYYIVNPRIEKAAFVNKEPSPENAVDRMSRKLRYIDLGEKNALLLEIKETGSARAQYKLGSMYYNGTPQNYEKAIVWHLKAGEQGYIRAQNMLGLMYSQGTGVPQDDKEAMNWYLKAAKQGNTSAQFDVAYRYRTGKGVPQDLGEAYAWHSVGAAHGDLFARRIRNAMGYELFLEAFTTPLERAKEYLNNK